MLMKRWICIVIIFFLQLSNIHAESYCVLVDGDNTVVEQKDMHKQQSVASISKIMTALIALEKGNLEDTWVCGKELQQAFGSMLYLKEGQSVSLRSMLYGLMLRSGNDAALEIALHIAKSERAFVKMMNDKAKEIGMMNTLFRNASGLDEKDGGNISTAYDMALLMSYAMKNDDFRAITGTQYYTSEWNWRWKNKNRLLFDYAFTNGGKTGFTKIAGRTLVTSAAYQDVESIVVTLRQSDDFAFHKTKHQSVFDQYDVLTLLKKGTYHIKGRRYQVKQNIQVSVKKTGNEKVNVKTHFEKKDIVIEVWKKEHVDIYTIPIKNAKGNVLLESKAL